MSSGLGHYNALLRQMFHSKTTLTRGAFRQWGSLRPAPMNCRNIDTRCEFYFWKDNLKRCESHDRKSLEMNIRTTRGRDDCCDRRSVFTIDRRSRTVEQAPSSRPGCCQLCNDCGGRTRRRREDNTNSAQGGYRAGSSWAEARSPSQSPVMRFRRRQATIQNKI